MRVIPPRCLQCARDACDGVGFCELVRLDGYGGVFGGVVDALVDQFVAVFFSEFEQPVHLVCKSVAIRCHCGSPTTRLRCAPQTICRQVVPM